MLKDDVVSRDQQAAKRAAQQRMAQDRANFCAKVAADVIHNVVRTQAAKHRQTVHALQDSLHRSEQDWLALTNQQLATLDMQLTWQQQTHGSAAVAILTSECPEPRTAAVAAHVARTAATDNAGQVRGHSTAHITCIVEKLLFAAIHVHVVLAIQACSNWWGQCIALRRCGTSLLQRP